jgi:polyketide synthase-associated protein
MAGSCDVAIDAYHAEVLADVIVKHLGTKGFCTVDAGLTKEQLNGAVADCLEVDIAGKFFASSHLIADGLLGGIGSTRIAHLQRPDAVEDSAAEGGASIALLDGLMSELGTCVGAETSRLGFGTSARSPGLLHETGDAKSAKGALEAKISETEASEWMVQFLRAKIMCLVLLGPEQARLKMTPFGSKEAHEVDLTPGDVVLVRADLLSHTLSAGTKTHVLSCFFLGDQSLASKRNNIKDEEVSFTPAARTLYAWIEDRLATYKPQFEDDESEMPDLPRSWLRAMNTCYYTGQRTVIQGSAARYPGVWESETWADANFSGPDVAVEVPIERWDVEEFYDTEPDAWKYLKTHNRHMGYCDGTNLFENKSFSISVSESSGMAPEQRGSVEGG